MQHTMRNTAQESKMNALGSCLFHDVVIKPKKYNNNQYYADNYLVRRSKGQYF